MKKSARAAEAPSLITTADLLPGALRNHLLDQQARACELEETLRMLGAGIDEGAGIVAVCARVARDLYEALDASSLRRVLERAEEAQAA